MLKNILLCKHALFYFIFITSIEMSSMENRIEDFIKNESLISQERIKYTHVFSAQEKKAALKDLKTKEKMIDKGLFQAYVTLSTDEKIAEKKRTYLLHKTCKYALDQLQIITSLKKIEQEEYSILIWKKLYNLLDQFKIHTNFMFTPHAMFNFLFQFGVLNDIASGREFFYSKKEHLIAHLEEYYARIPDTLDHECVYEMNNTVSIY